MANNMNDKVDELKEKVLKAQEQGDIAGLYVLELEAHELFDDETLSRYYANILELALERLTDTLEGMKKLKIDEVQDYATLRALYEYAIEHYSADKYEDASALFEILSGLCDDEKFKSSMMIHTKNANEKLSFDDFLEKVADIDATSDAGTFYISVFKSE